MIYAIANQKGGVGKTSTALALATGLSKRGKKVLAVDLDSQGNLTYSSGVEAKGKTIYELLLKKASVDDVIVSSPHGYDLIPSSLEMAAIADVITKTGREYKLKEALRAIFNSYDEIIIDTPPKLDLCVINALVAADKVIVPVAPAAYSLSGMIDFVSTVRDVKEYCNENLTIQGVLVTNLDRREKKNVREFEASLPEMEKALDIKVFETPIRHASAVNTAQYKRLCVYDTDPQSGVVSDYERIIDEILKEENY